MKLLDKYLIAGLVFFMLTTFYLISKPTEIEQVPGAPIVTIEEDNIDYSYLVKEKTDPISKKTGLVFYRREKSILEKEVIGNITTKDGGLIGFILTTILLLAKEKIVITLKKLFSGD